MVGQTGIDDARHVCITNTDSVLGFAIGALFVKEAFVGDSKAKVSVREIGVIQIFSRCCLSLGAGFHFFNEFFFSLEVLNVDIIFV